MARDNDAHGILAHGGADCASGSRSTDCRGKIAIGNDGTTVHFAESPPHGTLKHAPGFGMERDTELRACIVEVPSQLTRGRTERCRYGTTGDTSGKKTCRTQPFGIAANFQETGRSGKHCLIHACMIQKTTPHVCRVVCWRELIIGW